MLSAEYCRQFFGGSGVCIFIHKALKVSTINLHEFCKDKDFEVCAFLLELSYTKILVITVYRSTSGDFQLFLIRLEVTISKFFKSNLKLIICRDINLNYLVDTDRKRQLHSIWNLMISSARYTFPLEIKKSRWNTANDNIFIDTSAFSNFKIIPIINGLSDNDAQLLIIKDLHMCIGTNYMKTIGYIEECLLLKF